VKALLKAVKSVNSTESSKGLMERGKRYLSINNVVKFHDRQKTIRRENH